MYSIIVIEPDSITRRRIQGILKQAGHQVAIAKTLDRGNLLLDQAILQHSPPALILLNWDMDSTERWCQQLKSHAQLFSSYLICLSQAGTVCDRIQGFNAGADDFLNKPIIEAELIARVRAGLRMHQMQLDLAHQNRIIQSHNETLKMELEEATQYMRSRLPEPMGSPLRIDFRFIPSQHLGGDCFDYFWINHHQLALYLLDVSGHGMGATLMAMGILNDLRTQSIDADITCPKSVLSRLNQRIQISERHSKYLTIWYGVYDLNSERLTYASAGHPPALLIAHREGAPEILKTPGVPIGLLPNPAYHSQTHHISGPSTLYLFSDGIYEFPDHNGKIWGLSAFQSYLYQAQRQFLPLDTVLQQLQHQNTHPQFIDDLSILQITFHGDHSVSNKAFRSGYTSNT